MRGTVISSGVAAACGALVLGGALRAAAQEAPPSPAAKVDRKAFSNTWKLNLDESEKLRQLDEPPETLTIKQEDGAFLVGDDTGQIRRLHPDGRTMKTDNGEGQVRTRWHGDELVTETIPARGTQLRETFAIAPDGRRLFVTTHFEARMGGAVDVRRVYDAAEAP